MKKGFTLVELLAVLVLIGVLGLIVTTTVERTLKENKQKIYDMQVENIIAGAKVWAGKNVFQLPSNEDEFIIKSLFDLQQDGNLEVNIENPKTGEIFNPNDWGVKITKKNNSYVYELIEL